MKRLTGYSRTGWGRLGIVGLLGLVVVGTTVSVSLRNAVAQDQPPPPALQPMPPRPGLAFPPMFPPGGGPGIAMIALDGRIYIAQDGVLYKINPKTMTVEQELRYVKPRPGGHPMGGPAPGAPGAD